METKTDIQRDNYIKLKDILNSQESIAEKIGVLQVELFNHPDKELENKLNDLASFVAKAHEEATAIAEDYRTSHSIEEF